MVTDPFCILSPFCQSHFGFWCLGILQLYFVSFGFVLLCFVLFLWYWEVTPGPWARKTLELDFQIFILRQVLTCDLPTSASWRTGITGMQNHAYLLRSSKKSTREIPLALRRLTSRASSHFPSPHHPQLCSHHAQRSYILESCVSPPGGKSPSNVSVQLWHVSFYFLYVLINSNALVLFHIC